MANPSRAPHPPTSPPPHPHPAERVRDRIREWLDLTKQGQREFAAQCGGKSQVWLQKILIGDAGDGNDIRLRDLDLIAAAMRTSAAELVRGFERRFILELTADELRVLEQLRRNPQTMRGISILLGDSEPAHHPHPKARKRRTPASHDGDGDGRGSR
jgi:hypothetical protein